MSNISYRPLIEDMTWSFSRVNCFAQCRYQWFLKYIRGVKDTPLFYSSYGSFVHGILEKFYKGELRKEELPVYYLTKYRECVVGERPKEPTPTNYFQSGLAYFKTFRPLTCEILEIEKKITFRIGEIEFVGIIDIVGRDEDGKICIVDHKSRALKPRSSRSSLNNRALDEIFRQLYLYSAAIRAEYGEFPSTLCINSFRTGNFIEETFSEQAYEQSVKWVFGKIEEIKNEENFNPCPEYCKCLWLCGVREKCMAEIN